MTHPLTTQQKVISRRSWLCRRLVWAWLIPVLFLQPVSTRAVTLTNTTFADFLTAVQSGLVVFATNGTVIFDDVVVITNNTTIDATGFGVALSGNNAVRLFQVESNATLILANITIGNGNSTGATGESGADGDDDDDGFGDDGANGIGGNSAIAGAVYNQGTLMLIGCRVIGNRVIGGDGGDGGNGGNGAAVGGKGGRAGSGGKAQGGAIYNMGFVSAVNCTFSGNTVDGGSGGIGGAGGSGGSDSGLAGAGGAGAEGAGAAIYNLGRAEISYSTFSTNVSNGGNSEKARADSGTGVQGASGGAGIGGGIFNLGVLTAVNCTLVANQVVGGNGGNGGDGAAEGGRGGNGGLASGGGIYNAATAAITNCTFSGSGAFGGTNGFAGTGAFPGSDGSPGQSRGGNVASVAGRLVLANSILASGTNGGNGFRTVVTNLSDAGFNISSDNSLNLTNTGSLRNTNANLGPLGSFGGPTLTMMPLLGSPAIDRGSAGGCLTTDQRGSLRPQGANCDVGAVEAAGLTIQTQPQGQTNGIGANVTFTVIANGESPRSFQWRLNNVNINRATNSTLSLPNAQFTNAGTYLVVVANPTGSVTSAPAVLKLIAPVSLGSPSLSGETNFFFTFKTTNGLTYFLEFKNALDDANWIRLRTNIGNGNIITNLLPIGGTTSRFFRLVVQ